jgi:L-lactate dehydrogenase complex protein LldG
LRAAPDKPRLVSLLPRVHLALLSPQALRADLPQALADIKSDGYAVCITGPSRTSDIELTVTIGVHGPKSLYVWVVEV